MKNLKFGPHVQGQRRRNRTTEWVLPAAVENTEEQPVSCVNVFNQCQRRLALTHFRN